MTFDEVLKQVIKQQDEWLLKFWTDNTSAPGCQHEWKLYDGFTNRFEYCSKCDEKKQ